MHALPRSSSLIPLTALVLATFLVPGCRSNHPTLETFNKSGRVTAADFPDVPAVVLLDRSELTFSFSSEKLRPFAEILHTQRIQILRKDGLKYARFSIPFDDRSALLYIQRRLLKPDGTTIEQSADTTVDLMRFSPGSPEADLYNAVGGKLTKVSDAEVGDVVEVSYLRVIRDPRWIEPMLVSGTLPVRRGEVIVDYPKKFEIDYRVTRLGRLDKKIRPVKIPKRVKGREQGGDGAPGYRLAFVFENERAIFNEELRPALAAMATQVHVQLQAYTIRNQRMVAYRSWDDVAKWYNALTAGQAIVDDTLKNTVRKNGGRGGRKRQKLQRTQRFLQDKIRNVPTFLNLAALPPHRPGSILDAGVGDAKDQASLGLAMLRYLDIDGFPVLVSRAGSMNVVPDLPTPAPFNHVVLAVPAGGSYAWIDPSTAYLPTGRLPGALQGQRGLLIRNGRAELVDLPLDRPEQNQRRLSYKLALNATGTASGQILVQLEGLDAAAVRSLLKSGEPSNKIAEGIGAQIARGDGKTLRWLEALSVRQKKPNPDRPLKLQVIVGASEIAVDDKKGGLFLKIDRALGRIFPELWRERRTMPLVYSHRYVDEVQLSISLPAGMGIEALPEARVFEDDLVKVEERWSIADGTLLLSRTTTLKEREVLPNRYATMRTAITALWASHERGVHVIQGGDRGTAYGTDPF